MARIEAHSPLKPASVGCRALYVDDPSVVADLLAAMDNAGPHTHAVDDVEGLQAALDGKSATGHNHDGTYATAAHNHDAAYAAIGHTHEGGSSWEFPVGYILISTVNTNPATFLGYGTWSAFGAGKVLVGLDTNDTAFDTAEETGGAKTVAAQGTVSQPTFTGDAFSSVINHTHAVTITDPGHDHVENSNNATTGGLRGWGAADTSTNTSTATGYSTASSTTGITATTANPAGGVASITPTGTVSQPTFTGTATSVLQPYIVVYMFERTA